MYHLRKIKVLLATCLLACSSLWAQDTKISLENAVAEATSDQGGDEAASSAIDGNYGKIWHSQWSGGAVFDSKSSVDLTIALSEVTLVDYVRYIPRQDQNNGRWDEVEVFYSPNITGTNFISIGTFNLNYADIPHDFFLNGTQGVSCGQIKFTIRSGSNNHASAAEIEMYQLDKVKLNAFAQCFSDAVYTELKPGVTSSSIADADVRALVQSMQSDPTSYKKFRVGEYEAYETLGTLQQRLKTKNQYSRYENPTGVYFTKDQSYLVAVSGIEDDAVGLKVKNWYLSESSSTYSLRNGLNYITATTEGNVFVNYYTDNYAEAPKVKIHFINAPVIGYWDQETMTNSDWVALLADKASDDHRIIITQSEHAQTAFPISAWKTHCPDDVETLMRHYQDVQWAIRDMMGLEKYGYQTRNRQIFYVVNRGFMAAGDEGAYCNYGSLGGIMNPNSFDFWGVAHEWGHNNQIDPGFHWSGCGETTNNIYASWAQYHFTASRDAAGHPTELRLEDEVTGINDYESMRGGRMQTYFEEGLRKGVAWQLQDGPDYHNATPDEKTVTGRDAKGNDLGQVTTTSRNYDHFVKLSPFWQLNLWGNLAGKCPDIITDVIHSIRTAENYTVTYNTNGKQQINWMKLACDHAEIDLLPFFEKAGMLRPIHAYIEDYGAGWNIITDEMINELKAYVAQKGYPNYTEEINYINGHNYHIYRENLKLNVTQMHGELIGDKVIIQHSLAQNAVAFETYDADGELVRITMYGLGSDDAHSYTQVLYPTSEGANYIMAVGYDGERQMVYKERSAADLQTLMNKAQSLMNEVAQMEGAYTTQTVSLTADNYFCNALYTASNNGDKFTSYDVLCDGNPETYLHTDYSSNAPAEDHYVSVDLGSGNELTFFNLNYKTRYRGNACAPNNVVVEASNDNATWVILRRVTSGLVADNNKENTIAGLGDGTPYRYIRMRVLGTSTDQKVNGHYYFILSEMGLSELDYEVSFNDGYSLLSEGVVVAAYKAMQSAREAINSSADYTGAYDALNLRYAALLAAREAMDKLNTAKAPLQNLINQTSQLIEDCGGVVYLPETYDTELVLQASNPNGNWYVSSNADQNTGNGNDDGGGIAALVDNDYNTYFHTRWGGDVVSENHYIQVDMGAGVTIKDFVFSYTARNNSPAPTEMTISGSNDGSNFEKITLITKDWADYNENGAYTSGTIVSDKEYRYLRFTVTKSNGPGNEQYYGYYFFGMKEFDLTSIGHPESYVATPNSNAGKATADMMLATYFDVEEAQSVVVNATTEAEVAEAIAKLEEIYQALYDAKHSITYVDYTISSNISEGGIVYKGQNYTSEIRLPSTVDNLPAIEVEGYVAKSVAFDGNTIAVTYDKVYAVQVIGGRGNGGVTYGGKTLANGDTFVAPISLGVNDLGNNIIVPDGYTLKDVTIVGATVKISFSAIPLVDTSKYYTLECLSGNNHNTERFICDNGKVINGCSAEASLFLFEAADEDNGYYIKSYVSDKYINHANGAVYASKEKATIWTMEVPSHTPVARTLTVGDYLYLNNNSSDCTDASCINLQSNSHSGGPGANNACSLWTIAEGTPLDKSALLAKIEAFETVVDACVTDPLFVTEQLISEIRNIIADARAKYKSNATTQSEYERALTALYDAESTLATAKANAEAEAIARAEQLVVLREWIVTVNDLMARCMENSGDATQALINEVSDALHSANELAESPSSTSSELADAAADLEAKYAVLDAAQQSTAKAELRELIAQTQALIAQCGEVTFEEKMLQNKITLQTNNESEAGYLFCNAPYLADPNSGDYSPASKGYCILDENYATFLHTDWSNSAPSEDHYLRVSLGEIELSQFILKYSTRGAGGDVYPGNPKRIVVEGCNSVDGDYEEIAVLTSEDEGNGLPQGSQLSHYTSNVLENSENYKYIRFRVTENQSDRKVNGHCWFYISEFALMSVDYECEYTVVVDVNAGSVTKELLLDVFRANDDAKTLADNSSVQADLLAEKTRLQALYDALLDAATSVNLPVTLTTDATAPVLYTIKTKRGGNPVLQYDEATEMFSVTTAVAGQATQAFYFMKGDKVEGTQQVYIYPYMADGKVLAANDVTDGKEKALAMDKGTATYEQWVFVERADGYYNLQPAGTTTYLSNIYGTSSKMGFYSSNPAGDEGSLFKFEPTTVEGSYYYLKLKDYYETQAKVASSEIQGGTDVGCYPEAAADAYNTAYSNAANVLEDATATDEEYTNAYNALKAANEALNLIMPEVGKYYTIVSACNDNRGGQLMYATGENEMKFSGEKTAQSPEALWTFTKEGYMMNLQTGCYVGTSQWATALTLVEKNGATVVSFESLLTSDGQVMLKPGNGHPLHAQVAGSTIVGYVNDNNASAWRIVKVDVNAVIHTATLKYEHAGLFLNYAVAKPVGVKAYYIDGTKEINIVDGVGELKLTELEGDVIPARTAVILYAPKIGNDAKTYDFYYTADDSKIDNLLTGSAYTQYLAAEADHAYYSFGQKEGQVGLYKNSVKYVYDDEESAYVEAAEGATHYKVSANKVLFDWDASSQGVTSFRFSIGDETGIEGITIDADATIYDLYGRRVLEVVAPGLYIINGEKRYINIK